MHISNKMNHPKKEVLRVVLDEPRLYLEESLGSVMVRGEVIVNFPKDTQIQGPIELLFEGIQRFQTWPEIMRHAALGSPIETKLQVIELSLLPPNSKGIMPGGIQRFPFEFPIPASLPTTVYIPDRLEIFYQLSATIRRSSSSDQHHDSSINPINWIDWARRNSSKKKYVACSPMRIVRSMESAVSNGLPTTPSLSLTPVISSSAQSIANSTSTTDVQLPWNRRGLSEYQGTLDEQHDQLAFSLSGRTSGNLTQPIHMLDNIQGIRYKIGVDRTAIAIGTSIGLELMIEPTMADAVVKSVVLKVCENRSYSMKVPSDHTWSTSNPETKKINEGAKMILKWAYGYEVENDDGEMVMDKKQHVRHISGSDKYVRKLSHSSQFLAYFDPPQPGSPNNKFFLGNNNNRFSSDSKPMVFLDSEEEVQENNYVGSSASSSSTSTTTTTNNKSCDMLNLKELNQSVKVGEYFGGRFVMPVPDCSNILHPSMEYESITISHWLQLVVTIECNGKTFDLLLDSPSRILDCRVVSVDDDCQTILPPPPSYQPGDGHLYQENTWSTANTFWEQREAITSVSGWGACVPCPCQYKKMKQLKEIKEKKLAAAAAAAAAIATGSSKKNKRKSSNSDTAADTCPPNLLPEWGPPPCYSEN